MAFRRSERSAPDNHKRRAAWIGFAYALLTFAGYCVWKYFMAERRGDEAIFENCLWNAVHGNGLRSWLEGGHPHLAVHFSPMIYGFVPLYALWPTMHVPHLAVSLTTAAAGYGLFLFARPRLGDGAALAVMLAFLLHPTIAIQTFTEFHEQALAPLGVVLLVTGLFAHRTRIATLGAVYLLLLREDNVLLVGAAALYALFGLKRPRIALALLGAALAWVVVYVAAHRLWGLGESPPWLFTGVYGQWGSNWREMLLTMLQDPARVLRHLFSRPTALYLLQLLAPLLLILPLGSGLAALAVPQVLLVLLAKHSLRLFEIRLHYSVVPVTVLYLASVHGMVRWAHVFAGLDGGLRRLAAGRGLIPVASIALLCVSLALVPIWAVRAVGRLSPYTRQTKAALATLPDTASVAASMYLLNQLAQRRQLGFVAWEDTIPSTEYVVIEDPARMYFEGSTVDLQYSPEVAATLERAGFDEILSESGLHVFRRRAVP